jgi:hypothetical protein
MPVAPKVATPKPTEAPKQTAAAPPQAGLGDNNFVVALVELYGQLADFAEFCKANDISQPNQVR